MLPQILIASLLAIAGSRGQVLPGDTAGTVKEGQPINSAGLGDQGLPVDAAILKDQGKPIDVLSLREQGLPVGETILREQGQPIDVIGFREQGQPIDTSGFREQGQPIDVVGFREQGQPIDVVGVREQGQPIDAGGPRDQGHPIDVVGFREQGQPIDRSGFRDQGQPIDVVGFREQGQPIDRSGFREQGQPIDVVGFREQGQPINTSGFREQGQPIDVVGFREQGQPIDTSGFREQGQPIDVGGLREQGQPIAVGGFREQALPIDASNMKEQGQSIFTGGFREPLVDSAGSVDPASQPLDAASLRGQSQPIGAAELLLGRQGKPVNAVGGGQDPPIDAAELLLGRQVKPIDAVGGGQDPPMDVTRQLFGGQSQPIDSAALLGGAGKPTNVIVLPQQSKQIDAAGLLGEPAQPIALKTLGGQGQSFDGANFRKLSQPIGVAGHGRQDLSRDVGGVSAALRGGPVPYVSALAQEACFLTKCTRGDLCYIPHPQMCNKFIMCSTNDVGDVYAQEMPCAIGTFWNETQEACDTSDLVNCPNDPCHNVSLRSYGHDDTNCRTYYECKGGKTSKPQCCKPYHSYSQALDKCVKDASCDKPCPILDQAVCAGRGVDALYFPDDNCKTYWDCKGRLHPVCCKDGMSFDKFSGRCVGNSSCVDQCPIEYQDMCAKRGVKSYAVDVNCRTYMKCNKQGLDDPYCCPPGQEYSSVLKRCIKTNNETCKRQPCPPGFHKHIECTNLPVAGDKTLYNNTLANIIMPCAVGTIFKNCVCDLDPNFSVDTSVCLPAIHAKLPDLKNHGQATAALLMIGEYGQGEKGRGKMQALMDGTTGINIPYFGTQAPYKFYLRIILKPTKAPTRTQVLLSSCEYVKITNMPTIEISLKQLSDRDGNMTLRLSSEEASFQHNMIYQVDSLYRYTMIYDGKKVASILEPNDKALPVDTLYSPFTGPLTISRGGLRFAHCRYEQGVDSFFGYVSEIQIAKCLTQEMRDQLYPIAPL